MKSVIKNAQTVFCIFILMLLCGCAKNQDKDVVQSNAHDCQKTKLENQFIIHWKNGKKSLVLEKDIHTFTRLNKNQINLVEPNYLLQTNTIINPQLNPYDSEIPQLSAHDVIHTPSAWAQGIYGQGITVAIIDTGVALEHPQLRSRVAVNEIESRYGFNHIDDDSNGYVDDIFGWNFVSNTPNQRDEIGHGTAMAGIITGSPDHQPSLGLAPQAKILSVDFMDQDGGSEFHAHEAMAYALARKANIINNSWSISCSELLKNDFINWSTENVIFVNASGNNPVDVYQKGIIPSSLNLPNNLNVGSLDDQGRISTFSGFGDTVKIYAPGEAIPTIYPNSGLSESAPASGTSVSTAIVSGAAALVWSAFPAAKATDIISLIEDGAYFDSSFHRILDIQKSIKLGKKRFHRRPLTEPLLPSTR